MGSPSVRIDQPAPIDSSATHSRRGSTAVLVLPCAAPFMAVLDVSIVGVAVRTGGWVVLFWRRAICAVLGQPWHAGYEVHAGQEVRVG